MVATRLTFALRAPAFRNTASVQRIAAVRSFQSCRALAVGKESALGMPSSLCTAIRCHHRDLTASLMLSKCKLTRPSQVTKIGPMKSSTTSKINCRSKRKAKDTGKMS